MGVAKNIRRRVIIIGGIIKNIRVIKNCRREGDRAKPYLYNPSNESLLLLGIQIQNWGMYASIFFYAINLTNIKIYSIYLFISPQLYYNIILINFQLSKWTRVDNLLRIIFIYKWDGKISDGILILWYRKICLKICPSIYNIGMTNFHPDPL